MKNLKVKDFSLEHTLNCGQFFLYKKINDYFYIIFSEKIIKIRQKDLILEYDGIEEKDLIFLFSLDIDLKEFKNTCKNDKHLLFALEKYWGLRIMRQDLWQTIIAFICSSAASVEKIQKNLFLLSENFGEKIIFDNIEFYLFPKVSRINDLEKIINSKIGYRAKYILNFNNYLEKNENFLSELKKLNYLEAKKTLMEFMGIGPKIADCICLFGLYHNEAFPIDRWIKLIIEELYLENKSKNIKEIENYLQKNFQGNIGLKQQYLFHYIRNNGISFLKTI